MNIFKEMWNRLHEDDKFYVILIILMVVCFFLFGPGTAVAQVKASEPVHVTITVSEKGAAKAEKVGTIDVETKKKDGSVETKRYDLYRGSKGGYFYYTGKKDKSGKPEKRYLTKKQKQERGLK